MPQREHNRFIKFVVLNMGYRDKQYADPKFRIMSQVVEHLNEITKLGESRHKAKQIGEASEYIYSIRTYDAYKEAMERLVVYCLQHHPEVKHVNDCKKYVPEYIEKMIQDGLSSYSQKCRLCGYRKFYKDPFEGVVTESRKRSEIKRGRKDTLNARIFNEELHAPLVHFCKCTGLRRSELESLRGGCVSLHDDGNYYIDHIKGKGGKIRDVRILNNDQEVIDKIMNTSKDQLVWGRVHSKANIHGYRADYTSLLYESIARDIRTLDKKEIYVCRGDMASIKLDREAMRVVSLSLGHQRINVISQHYLVNYKK